MSKPPSLLLIIILFVTIWFHRLVQMRSKKGAERATLNI